MVVSLPGHSMGILESFGNIGCKDSCSYDYDYVYDYVYDYDYVHVHGSCMVAQTCLSRGSFSQFGIHQLHWAFPIWMFQPLTMDFACGAHSLNSLLYMDHSCLILTMDVCMMIEEE